VEPADDVRWTMLVGPVPDEIMYVSVRRHWRVEPIDRHDPETFSVGLR
jgi:hypothetical protein